MSQTSRMVTALKKCLHTKGATYRNLVKWGRPLASLCQEGDQHPADKQHIYLFTPSLVSFASVISLQGIGLKKAPHQSPIWIKTVGPANNSR